MRQRFDQIRSGSTVPHLTCGAVKELMIALPDLPAQRRVVEHSQELREVTQRLASLYERKLAVLGPPSLGRKRLAGVSGGRGVLVSGGPEDEMAGVGVSTN